MISRVFSIGIWPLLSYTINYTWCYSDSIPFAGKSVFGIDEQFVRGVAERSQMNILSQYLAQPLSQKLSNRMACHHNFCFFCFLPPPEYYDFVCLI